MKRRRNSSSHGATAKVACAVSAAALMLGASHAATVGFNFQCNYCGEPTFSGVEVGAPAFGVAPLNWQNLSPMNDGDGVCPAGYFTLTNVITTTTTNGGLHPLPNGSLTVSWSAYTANVSEFGGYTRPGPNYIFFDNQYKPGHEQVYWGFLRDGLNDLSSFENNQPGYVINITGLKSLFTNTPFAIQLIASSDSMEYLTNAFIIDAALNSTQSVTYPETPPVADRGVNAGWVAGSGGGLSITSSALDTDHIQIIGNHALHVAGSNFASSISGFIITDKPVISMPPNPVVVCPGDTVVWRGYAVGVPPLSYQWRKDGAAIAGATNNAFGLTNVSSADYGSYDLLVTNRYGSASSVAGSPDHLAAQTGHNYVVDSNPSGPALNGLALGATWLPASGTRTGAMSFNATNADQIVVPGHTNFDSASGTIAFWMRSLGPTNTSLAAPPSILFDRNGDNSSGGLLIKQLPTGEIKVDSSANAGPVTLTPLDTDWHLVTVTYERAANGNVSLYVDNQFDNAVQNASGWAWTPGQELEFGLSHDTQWQAYNGLIDDVRVYNRVLTGSEISSLFSGTLADDPSLILRLNFDTSPVPGISFSWQCPEAVLQSADVAPGPYSDLTYAVSPYHSVFPGAKKFYRYRANRVPQTMITNPYLM